MCQGTQMFPNEAAIRQAAEAAGQGHVFQFWAELSDEQRALLLNDLAQIDFVKVNRYYERLMAAEAQGEKQQDVQPLSEDITSRSPMPARANQNPEKVWATIGTKEIASGHVAVVLLAGGQGTRLGSSAPKGMYDVGLPSKKSLFQIQAERLRKVTELANKQHGTDGVLPWYVMTSEPTHEPTVTFFKDHNYFGLDPTNVMFFQQNTLPCLTMQGKIILDQKHRVAEAPDGNGGIYRAMVKDGVLADMHRRGIQHIHAYCVDNVLVKVADPAFIGFCALRKADTGAKVVAKEDPHESVGVLCRCGGQYKIVEYSEISKEVAERTNEDGALAFDAANIANHYFSISFLDAVCNKHYETLLHHVAKKKIPTVDAEGGRSKVDGMKMELFIFDIFQFSDHLAVYYGKRTNEFSPLKNAPGSSSCAPEHCREDLLTYHRCWIQAAGGKYADSDTWVEVSPLVSYDGEGLEERVAGKVFHGVSMLETEQEARDRAEHAQ